MASNTQQELFIERTRGNLDAIRPDFVAGDVLWYPVEGNPRIRMAPDVLVAVGRPKGHRGSYRQWEEGGEPPAVVFEWWSPDHTFAKAIEKHKFYERYGVREFYAWDQLSHVFTAYVRIGGDLVPVDTSDGWVSPLLGIRFEVHADELRMYGPDGRLFRDFQDVVAERDTAEQAREVAERARETAEQGRAAADRERDAAAKRAAALAARLRALGLDPDEA